MTAAGVFSGRGSQWPAPIDVRYVPEPEPPWPDEPAIGPRAEVSRQREGVRRRTTLEPIGLDALLAESEDPPAMLGLGVPKVGVTVLAGPPKVGKSALALQCALTVGYAGSDDRPLYLGGPADLGDVLYIVEEGSRAGIRWRASKQLGGLGIDSSGVQFLHRQRVRLDDPTSVTAIRALVEERKPALVVVDPLNRAHGKNEDRATEMTPVMDALSGIAYDHDCAVLLVHHVNKPAEGRNGFDRQRGSTAIRSASDANLILDREGGVLHLVGEFRDAEPLSVYLQLDPDTLLLDLADSPEPDGKVPAADLRAFVLEKTQVTARDVMAKFGVKSKVTARNALEALVGLDWYDGARGTRFYTLGTGK